MVAISLYKGNLRKATDAPRQWMMPTPQITVKDFRSLLRRRARSLSRLPNPSPNIDAIESAVDNRAPNAVKEEDKEAGNASASGGDRSVKVELDAENKAELDTAVDVKEEEKAIENAANPSSQTIDKAIEECSDPARKKEVEEKLNALKEQKHSLVQVLKMIQNAEEELKRRNSTQGVTGRPNVSLQLQVDIPNDSGSITKLNTPTPKVRSDGNRGTTGAEAEGVVPDGLVNDNSDSRHLVRMSSKSPSPSSDSQHKKPAHNSILLPGRAPGGVAASPSRFAPSAPQGHTSSLPTVSVSGTNYAPSSPSPAASGGTSVFRENRMTSPWN